MQDSENWTDRLRRLARDQDDDPATVETFAELRARAKAAGVSAAGSRATIEARLAGLEG